MLKTHKEFEFVYRRGKSAHSRSSVLFYLPRDGERKIGYTASKKVGNAVIRNRSKRRLRSLFADQRDALIDGHYIFVAKASLHSTPYKTLQRDFKYIIKKLGVTKAAA